MAEKPIEKYTDTELLAVIRKAENTDISGSLYQRANNEWQIRQQQKLLQAKGHNGVFFEVGGNMVNHGIIQTAKNAIVDIAVAGDYSSNKNTKIIQGYPMPQEKFWHEKPLGRVILAVISALLAGSFLYWI